MIDWAKINLGQQGHVADPLTHSLVMEGYDVDAIEAGLGYFIDQWEEAVAWRQRAYLSGTQSQDNEFRYYLFCRTELYWALRQVTVAQRKRFSARITRADQTFRKTLLRVGRPFCAFPEIIDSPEPKRHWWLFSQPKIKQSDDTSEAESPGWESVPSPGD